MSSKPDKQQYGENMDPNRNNPAQGQQQGRTDQPGQQKENDKNNQQGGGGGQQQR